MDCSFFVFFFLQRRKESKDTGEVAPSRGSLQPDRDERYIEIYIIRSYEGIGGQVNRVGCGGACHFSYLAPLASSVLPKCFITLLMKYEHPDGNGKICAVLLCFFKQNDFIICCYANLRL